MRESTVYTFNFWYVNEKGNRRHLLPKKGRVNLEGIVLDEERIFLEDIQQVEIYRKYLVLDLYPYIPIGKEITKNILERHCTLVIKMAKVYDSFSFKAAIDRGKGIRLLNARIKTMTPQEVKEKLRKKSCPHCDALLDLTNEPETEYIFCTYCEGLFDRHGYKVAGVENYRICPECYYFGKVGPYKDYDFYINQNDRAFKSKTYNCCDTCVNRMFYGTLVRNLPLLFGALAMVYEKIKAYHRRHPSFEYLEKANKHGQERNFGEARNLYDRILIRLNNHPGILYNMGLMHLFSGNKESAKGYFERGLRSCANYKPIYHMLEKYKG